MITQNNLKNANQRDEKKLFKVQKKLVRVAIPRKGMKQVAGVQLVKPDQDDISTNEIKNEILRFKNS